MQWASYFHTLAKQGIVSYETNYKPIEYLDVFKEYGTETKGYLSIRLVYFKLILFQVYNFWIVKMLAILASALLILQIKV